MPEPNVHRVMNRYIKYGLSMDYYSALTKNEILIQAITWMSLRNILNKEASH